MHTQFVADCVFPHTDNLLLTGSGDGTTALWDIETASMIQVSYNFELQWNVTWRRRRPFTSRRPFTLQTQQYSENFITENNNLTSRHFVRKIASSASMYQKIHQPIKLLFAEVIGSYEFGTSVQMNAWKLFAGTPVSSYGPVPRCGIITIKMNLRWRKWCEMVASRWCCCDSFGWFNYSTFWSSNRFGDWLLPTKHGSFRLQFTWFFSKNQKPYLLSKLKRLLRFQEDWS